MRSKHTLILWTLCALAAAPAPAAGPQNAAGFIHGTVETKSGNSYTGLLRWGTEEAFWDDLFNGTKNDLPYGDREDRGERKGRIRTPFGTIRYNVRSTARQFIGRFGDIAEIRPGRGDRAELTLKGGHEITLDGGSNDIGASITVDDASLGQVKLDWNKIERIRFSATPASARPNARRLYGKLATDAATFEGYIQWDSQECLTTDKLDGDTDDGDVSIEMGKIRRIEKRSRRAALVELDDGRRLVLDGSNDVNSSIRGIFVEDPRFGRVRVTWEAFDHVEFVDHDRSGAGYDDYKATKPLRGVVSAFEGATYSGEIVFDLDESHDFESLNGDRDGVEYYIPFSMVRSIAPGPRDSSKVVLKSGAEVLLADGQDVSENNAGVVVLREGNGREAYLPWRDVERIDFK